MLETTRRVGERIDLGDGTFVVVLRIGKNNVKLGIEAPRNMDVIRGELRKRVVKREEEPKEVRDGT